MRPQFAVSTTVITLAATLFAVQLRSSLAQNTPAPPAPPPTQAAPSQAAPGAAPALSEAAVRGQAIFGEKCSLCHNADSEEQKIGPGLKGFYKRGTYTSSGNKVTDENLVEFISHGQGLMPAFKDSLGPAKIQDAVAYVKTL